MRRVLIVEDESLIALDLADILEELGFEVIGPAATADAACRLAAEHSPDLVLMDIRIRGERDGIEAAREILRWHPTAIIFLTAESDPATRSRASELRPRAYLPKPVTPARVGQVVREALPA